MKDSKFNPLMFLKKIATPTIMIASAIVFGSGLYMYFIGKFHSLEELHANLGLIFVSAAVFHVLRNWGSTKTYFKKKTLYFISVILIGVGASIYFSEEEPSEGSPKMIVSYALKSDIATLSPLFKVDPEAITNQMKKDGLEITSGDSLQQIARKNSIKPSSLFQYFMGSASSVRK